MPMTFGDLRSEVLAWLDESDAATTDATYTNVEAAIKQAHTLRLTEDNWRFMLWPRLETITTVANQKTYSLHQEFLRPFAFRNRTKRRWLIETPARNVEPVGVDWTADTDTDRYALWGRSDVYAQPTTPSTLSLVSSSGSDTGVARLVRITGDTASGMVTEDVEINGTTPQATTNTFRTVISITKLMSFTGTVTVTANGGTTTVLALGSSEYARSYQQLELLSLPTAGEVLEYRFYRKPRTLSHANQVTDIPEPFERILVYDALLLMAAYDNRLDRGRVSVWTDYRDALDIQMRQAFMEGQSINGEGRYIIPRGPEGGNRAILGD